VKGRRIVLVLHEPPVPFGANAAGRWFYVLFKGLVEAGHRVTAFALWSRAGDRDEAVRLFPQGEFDLRLYEHGSAGGWAGKWSSFWRPCSYSFSPQFRADLRRELDRGFDLLHLETLWTGWVGLEHRQRAILNLHSLYRIDQSLDRPCRWSDRLRRWCVWRGERWLIRQYPVHIALSSRLADSIKAIHPKAAVHTIPLGLDLTGYAFQPKAANGGAPSLGLIGSFGWGPTDLAGHRLLARLWPAIHRRVPPARPRIVRRHR